MRNELCLDAAYRKLGDGRVEKKGHIVIDGFNDGDFAARENGIVNPEVVTARRTGLEMPPRSCRKRLEIDRGQSGKVFARRAPEQNVREIGLCGFCAWNGFLARGLGWGHSPFP